MLNKDELLGEKARNLMEKSPSRLLRVGTYLVIILLFIILALLWRVPYYRFVEFPCRICQIDSIYIATSESLLEDVEGIKEGAQIKIRINKDGNNVSHDGRVRDIMVLEDSLQLAFVLEDAKDSLRYPSGFCVVAILEQPVLKRVMH